MINATIQSVLSVVSASVSSETVTADVQTSTPSITVQVQQGVTGPAGVGDMESLIYDPGGIRTNIFDAGNLLGNLDGGTFN